MSGRRVQTLLSILFLTFWKGVGMALSLAIAMGIAHFFGASSASDAYFFARKIVSNIAMGFERAFHLVQVPPIIALARRSGIEALRTHLGRLTRMTFLVTCVLSGLCIYFAQDVVTLLAPGFDEAQVARTVPFLQVLLLTVPISAVTGLAGATLNALRLFSLPAVARLLPRLMILAALVAGPTALGIGLLPWAALVGTTAMGAFFAVAIFRALRSNADIKQDTQGGEAAQFGKKRMFAMVLAQAHLIGSSWIDMAFASVSGVGGIATLEFGQRLTNIAPGVASNSVTSVYYTEFARCVSDGDDARFRSKISEAMRTAFFFAVPLAAMIFVFAEPAVAIVLQRGAFDAASAAATARIVEILALLLPVNALLGVTVSVIFADPRMPHVTIIASSTFVAIAVRLALATLLIGSLGVIAVPIASLIAMGALFVMCYAWVSARIGQPVSAADALAFGKIVFAGAVALAVAWVVSGAVSELTETRFLLAIAMGVSAVLAAVAFVAAARLLGLPETEILTRKITKRLRRR